MLNYLKQLNLSIGRFVEVYDELGKTGILLSLIQMMRSISGTVDAARLAADITETNVTVDSDFTSRSMGMIVKEGQKQHIANPLKKFLRLLKMLKNALLFI